MAIAVLDTRVIPDETHTADMVYNIYATFPGKSLMKGSAYQVPASARISPVIGKLINTEERWFYYDLLQRTFY